MDVARSETFIVQYLDSIRVLLLRWSLGTRILRRLYSRTHYRLAAGMVISTAFYLPVAFLRPQLLLAIGPLIFGYPHLVASYRFTSAPLKKYRLFILTTILAIALHVSKVGFAHYENLPFGVWQIIVATLTLIISLFLSKNLSWMKTGLALLVCIGLVRLAWLEPVMYVGGTLIVHNWVAFIYWITACKQRARRVTAVLSTLLFLIIHLLVFYGHLDSWIPVKDGAITFSGSTQVTGWYLASWTTDALVWYRFLVLYTFGLSIHYFVWLRAIPESLSPFEHPHCFRLSLSNLKQNLGKKTLIFTGLFIIAGTAVWLVSLPLGSKIYFEIAILHGSLELIYLVPKLVSKFKAIS
jgi:hypothetical protein